MRVSVENYKVILLLLLYSSGPLWMKNVNLIGFRYLNVEINKIRIHSLALSLHTRDIERKYDTLPYKNQLIKATTLTK